MGGFDSQKRKADSPSRLPLDDAAELVKLAHDSLACRVTELRRKFVALEGIEVGLGDTQTASLEEEGDLVHLFSLREDEHRPGLVIHEA